MGRICRRLWLEVRGYLHRTFTQDWASDLALIQNQSALQGPQRGLLGGYKGNKINQINKINKIIFDSRDSIEDAPTSQHFHPKSQDESHDSDSRCSDDLSLDEDFSRERVRLNADKLKQKQSYRDLCLLSSLTPTAKFKQSLS